MLRRQDMLLNSFSERILIFAGDALRPTIDVFVQHHEVVLDRLGLVTLLLLFGHGPVPFVHGGSQRAPIARCPAVS